MKFGFFHFLPILLLEGMDGGAGGTGSGAGAGAGAGSGSQSSSQQSSSSSVAGVDTGQGDGQRQQPSGNGQGQGQQQQQSDPNANDPAYGNWRQLRDQRDEARRTAAAHEAQVQTWNKVSTEAATLAQTLGFTAEDFQEAFRSNPIRTLQILAQTQAQRQGQQGQGRQGDGQQQQDGQGDQNRLDDLINRRVTEATKPVSDFVNTQMTEAAMVKYETNLTESITADPILKGAPPEVHEIVKDYLGEYFATQPQLLLAFKQKGDFAPVKEAVTYIAGRLQGAFTAWLKSTNNSGGYQGRQQQGQGQQGTQRPGNGKVSLDDIINDPGVLGDQYKGN